MAKTNPKPLDNEIAAQASLKFWAGAEALEKIALIPVDQLTAQDEERASTLLNELLALPAEDAAMLRAKITRMLDIDQGSDQPDIWDSALVNQLLDDVARLLPDGPTLPRQPRRAVFNPKEWIENFRAAGGAVDVVGTTISWGFERDEATPGEHPAGQMLNELNGNLEKRMAVKAHLIPS